MMSRALRKHKCTLYTRKSGFNEDGEAVIVDNFGEDIYCCMQPEGEGNFIAYMQSGDNITDYRLLMTQCTIFAGIQGGNTSDRIEYKDTSYKVVGVKEYDALENLSHYEVSLKKIKRLST